MTPASGSDAQAADSAGAELQKPELQKTESPAGFGAVAKKIRSRTMDLLAIAIVLMGGLAVGSRVRVWWNTDENVPDSPVQTATEGRGDATPWGADGMPVSMDFGNSPHSVTRTSFVGNPEASIAKLVQQCRKIVQTATRPVEIPQAAEQRMLKRLALFEPVESGDDRWQIYRFDGPIMMATATRRFDVETGSEADPSKPKAAGDRRDAFAGQRVVCWGLAFPAGKERWTLFTFQPRDGNKGTTTTATLPDRPPNTSTVFALRDERGRAWLTFRGPGPIAKWMPFFMKQKDKHDWTIETPWQTTAEITAATFSGHNSNGRFRIDITFTAGPSKQPTGTVIVTPLK